MMHLSKLSIQHFRGVFAEKEVSFARPNGQEGSGLTILVGPNNSGKSTVVEAVRHAIAPPNLLDKNERHVDYPLRISIRDTAKGFREITNPGLGANIASAGEAHPSIEKFRYIPSRRSWSHRTEIRRSDPRTDSKQYWKFRTNYSRQEDGDLISRLNSLPPEEMVAYQQALRQLAPQLMNWRIEYSSGSIYIEYVTVNGVTHTTDLFGDGIASLFRIVLALYDPEESFVVIDEPELSLHPQAQKRLARFIAAKAKDRQIVLCTHSPYFLNWNDLAAGAEIYRLRQDRYGIQINRLSGNTISSLHKLSDDWQKPQLLDAVAKEVFFADEVLFLEGQEDVSLVSRFVEAKGLAPIQLFGYGVGGSKNIIHFLSMATDLKIPCGAVFDGTSKDDYLEALKRFPEIRLELLPTDDIRDKPPTNERKGTEGIFDRKGLIKPEFRDTLLAMLQEFRDYFDEAAAL